MSRWITAAWAVQPIKSDVPEAGVAQRRGQAWESRPAASQAGLGGCQSKCTTTLLEVANPLPLGSRMPLGERERERLSFV